MINPFNPSNPGQPNDRKKTGTGFTNLNRIMSASQGNKLGQAVGGGVVAQAGQAKNALNQARTGFNQEAEANRLDSDANKQKVQQGIQAANTTGQVDDNTVKDFSTFRAGQYAGPQNLKNETQVINQAQNAQNLGAMAGSAGGRQALLQRFVGGAGYSQGKQRLDNLLLGQSGGQDLRNARRETQGLSQEAQRTADAARQTGQYLTGQAQEFGNQVKRDLDNTFGGLQGEVDSRKLAFNDQRRTDLARIEALKPQLAFNKDAQTTELAQEDLDFLTKRGFDPNSDAFNLDVGNYLKAEREAQRVDVARQADVNRGNALARLTGQDLNETRRGFLGDISSNAEKLGSLDGKDASKFDNTAFQRDSNLAAEDRTNKLLSSMYTGASGVQGNQGVGADAIKARYATQGITDPKQIYKLEQERAGKLDAAKSFYNQQSGPVAEYDRRRQDMINEHMQRFGYVSNQKALDDQINKTLGARPTVDKAQLNQMIQAATGYAGPAGGQGSTDIGHLGDYGHFFNNQSGWASEAIRDAQNVQNDKMLGNLRKIVAKKAEGQV